MQDFLTPNNQQKGYNWKVFWMTLVSMFTIVTLQFFHVRLPRIISPIAMKDDPFVQIVPKLEEVTNHYSLKKPQSIIPHSYAAGPYEDASAYVVINFDTGDVIAEKNMAKKLPIASLTKIMTAVVALDLASPDESFRVSENAANQIPTKIVMTPGDTLTLDELLRAALLTSANDAVEVIKEGVNAKYHSDIFVRAMNEKAQLIGLKNTHFTNPQGFDNPEHYSSVEDLAILSQYAMTHYPEIADLVKRDQDYLPATLSHGAHKLYNWNGLLDVYPGIDGVKIGNTEAAGKTTVVMSTRENKRVLAVVLGAPGIVERDMWSAQLLDLGFQQAFNMKPIDVQESELRAKYRTWI